MGNVEWHAPDLAPPEPTFKPKFDPMLGFPNGRKERVVKTTVEEMISAAVPPHLRDFCIDKHMDYLACRNLNFPLMYRCKHELHAVHDCQYEDYVLRMKEYEREKRLSKLAAAKSLETED